MRRIPAVLIVLVLAAAACSDDSEASNVCDFRDELRTSVQDLRDVNVREDGIQELDDQLTVVLADVDQFRDAAAESAAGLAPQVDTLRTSVQALQTELQSGAPAGELVVSAISALADISADWDALSAAAAAECE